MIGATFAFCRTADGCIVLLNKAFEIVTTNVNNLNGNSLKLKIIIHSNLKLEIRN